MIFNNPWIRKPNFSKLEKLDYDEYWRRRGWQIAHSLKPREKIILDIIPPGSKVIDIGCGNSRLPLELRKKGINIVVADISELVIAEYAKEGVESFKLDLNDLSSAGYFSADYIIMSEVLEHLVYPEDVINFLRHRTKFFILTVPNSAAYQFRYGLLIRGRFFTQWVFHPAEHLRFWSHLDFLDWLEAQNLKILRIKVAEGFSLRGRLLWLPSLWKNFLGFRMVYLCEPK